MKEITRLKTYPMKRVIVDYAKLTNEILTLLLRSYDLDTIHSDVVRLKTLKE